MSLQGSVAAARASQEPSSVIRRSMRAILVGLGLVIMVIGVPIAILPWLHIPGALLVAVGLVLVLRNSFSARRTFIKAQRRHPKIVFPIRRLIRREPEVIQVFWHQTLRTERWVVPKKIRFFAKLRRSVMRRRKPKA